MFQRRALIVDFATAKASRFNSLQHFKIFCDTLGHFCTFGLILTLGYLFTAADKPGTRASKSDKGLNQYQIDAHNSSTPKKGIAN